MILGQIAYVDCVVFLIFLIPQLLLRVNFFELVKVAVEALPFLSMSAIDRMSLGTNLCLHVFPNI